VLVLSVRARFTFHIATVYVFAMTVADVLVFHGIVPAATAHVLATRVRMYGRVAFPVSQLQTVMHRAYSYRLRVPSDPTRASNVQ
jgi:hypothetical protein